MNLTRLVKDEGELGLIFVLALALRLLFVSEWQDLPYALSPFLDAKAYDDWALNIASGQWLGTHAFYQSPLYSYVLAAFYHLFGHSLERVALAQALLGSVTCAWLALLTRKYFGRVAGFFAGLLAAADRLLIFYSAPTLKETLMVFTLVAFVFYALALVTAARKRDGCWAGLWLGLTALLRGNVLALFFVLVGAALWRWRLRAAAPLFLSGLTLALTLAPAGVHNWWASHDLVLINSCGGLTFYVGNSPSANGRNSYPPFISSDIAQEEADSRRIAEEQVGHSLRPSEVSAYWFQQGWDYFRSHPRREFSLVLHKLWYFWNDYEIPDNYDSEFLRRELPTLLRAPLIGFGLVALLAYFAIVMTVTTLPATQVLWALALVYMLTVMPFLVSDRYRLPELIFLLPLAGLTLAKALSAWRERAWRAWIGPAVGAIPFALLIYLPFENDLRSADAFNWGLQATLLSDAQRDPEAVAAIAKALQADPNYVSSDAYVKASTSQERLGHLGEAEALLREAIQVHPHEGLNVYNLARFQYEHGDLKGAAENYQQALKLMPYLHQPYIGLAILHWKLGEWEPAREAVEQGLRRAPENNQLHQLEQMLRAHEGSR